MAPLLLRCPSFAVTTQKAKDGRGNSEEKDRGKMNSENQNSEEEGKTSPFIGLLKIEFRPLDHTQRTSTTGGSKIRSTVGNTSLFKR